MTGEPREVLPGWAITDGHVSVRLSKEPRDRPDLADRYEIAEVINRYAWAYDERDMGALEDIFALDAVYSGQIAGEPGFGPYTGRAAILSWFADYMEGCKELRRHVISNVIFKSCDETSAVVNAYLSLHAIRAGLPTIISTGFYCLELSKTSGRWEFSKVFAGFDSPFGALDET